MTTQDILNSTSLTSSTLRPSSKHGGANIFDGSSLKVQDLGTTIVPMYNASPSMLSPSKTPPRDTKGITMEMTPTVNSDECGTEQEPSNDINSHFSIRAMFNSFKHDLRFQGFMSSFKR